MGIIAEVFFGYNISDEQPGAPPLSPAQRAANARALGNGIFVVVAIPFAVCAAIYSLLYGTYPADRARAQHAQELAMVRDPSFVGLPSSGGDPPEGDPDTELGEFSGGGEERATARAGDREKEKLLRNSETGFPSGKAASEGTLGPLGSVT